MATQKEEALNLFCELYSFEINKRLKSAPGKAFKNFTRDGDMKKQCDMLELASIRFFSHDCKHKEDEYLSSAYERLEKIITGSPSDVSDMILLMKHRKGELKILHNLKTGYEKLANQAQESIVEIDEKLAEIRARRQQQEQANQANNMMPMPASQAHAADYGAKNPNDCPAPNKPVGPESSNVNKSSSCCLVM